ncbi:MAG: phospho-sugar mutase, partial [Lachnospiraceae bacterium]|nr:phospho-sugar mutase [Lachnospiraceae bacterium]
MNARDVYESWLKNLDRSNPLYAELEAIKDDEKEITERFYREIEFGTAGLRGICGAGTNRMNEFTVGRATQGIANYINKSGEDVSRGVAIAYDCRYFSKEFSELAAEILAGNGIKAYIFPSLRPTPELSFAVRKLNAVAGINMTASHNPKEYNGYKVYWADGAQISGGVSDGMLAEIQALDMFDTFKRIPLNEAVAKGSVVMLGEEMDRDYLDYVKGLAIRDDSELDLNVSVVYTPLNGAGSVPMMKAAADRGFKNFVIVPE